MASYLPTIKCSSCNADIEISMMGDHVCSDSPIAAEAPEPWVAQARAPSPDEINPYEMNSNPYATSSYAPKQGRAPPSSIDSSAASTSAALIALTDHLADPNTSTDRPFMRNNTLAASTYSRSHSKSPFALEGGPQSPFRSPNRSATSPLPRHAPAPSLELPTNLDCAFPPFPTGSASGRRTPASPRTPPGLDGSSRKGYHPDELDPTYKPVSPKSNGNVLKRMNTIAPGPFGVGPRRRDAGESASTGSGHERTPTYSGPYPTSANMSTSIDQSRSPSIAASELSNASDTSKITHRRVPTLANGTMASRPGTPRTDSTRKVSVIAQGSDAAYDQVRLGSVSQAPLSQEDFTRSIELPSTTIPRKPSLAEAPKIGLPRRPSELRTTGRRPTLASIDASENGSESGFGSREPVKEFEDSGRRPSRKGSKASLYHEQTISEELAPPLPNIPQSNHNPRLQHTSTESQSSNGSGYGSEARTGSSRSTPPLPEPSENSTRRMPASSPFGSKSRSPRDKAQNQSNFKPGHRRDGSPASIDKPLPSRPPQESTKPAPQTKSSRPRIDLSGYGAFGNPYEDREPRRSSLTTEDEPPHGRRPSTASKGTCRGCGETIRGKSVSSADGRLTGRYHKQCTSF